MKYLVLNKLLEYAERVGELEKQKKEMYNKNSSLTTELQQMKFHNQKLEEYIRHIKTFVRTNVKECQDGNNQYYVDMDIFEGLFGYDNQSEKEL